MTFKDQKQKRTPDQWKTLAKNDWGEILELSQKKTFQRKFKIVESFIDLVAAHGIYQVSYHDIAKKCKTSRQLVEHHFPDRNSLMLLSYRYIYARLQKTAADAVTSRKGFLNQFHAYVVTCAQWIENHPNDNCFLMQVYAVSHTHPELNKLFIRNTKIGNERLLAMLNQAKEREKLFNQIDQATLEQYASAIQFQIIGYAVLSRQNLHQDLWKSCLNIIGIKDSSVE